MDCRKMRQFQSLLFSFPFRYRVSAAVPLCTKSGSTTLRCRPGNGSNGSPFLDGSHGSNSWITAGDPLTRDKITAQWLAIVA